MIAITMFRSRGADCRSGQLLALRSLVPPYLIYLTGANTSNMSPMTRWNLQARGDDFGRHVRAWLFHWSWRSRRMSLIKLIRAWSASLDRRHRHHHRACISSGTTRIGLLMRGRARVEAGGPVGRRVMGLAFAFG